MIRWLVILLLAAVVGCGNNKPAVPPPMGPALGEDADLQKGKRKSPETGPSQSAKEP